jgi:DNA-binding transcriptional regulator YdaS (Cro superfamily)
MIESQRKEPVKMAVEMLGGATKASNVLGVSNGTVHLWVKLGRISDIDKARQVAEITGIAITQLRPIT